MEKLPTETNEAYVGGVMCSICSNSFGHKVKEGLMHCKKCEYDLCPKCCKMEFLKNDEDNPKKAFRRCDECDYDICEKCVTKFLDKQSHGSGIENYRPIMKSYVENNNGLHELLQISLSVVKAYKNKNLRKVWILYLEEIE